MREQSTFTYEIIKHVGVITEHESGWKKELNIVSWNGNPPRFDIRDWNPTHEHMSKGITLAIYEGAKLAEMIQEELAERG